MSQEIVEQSREVEPEAFQFELIPLNERTMAHILAHQRSGLGAKFSSAKWAPRHIVGIGDVVSVVVWEKGGDRLFSDGQMGTKTELGPFMVSQEGTITVPYIGKVHASGKSVSHLQEAIQLALEGQATNPQVIVTLKSNTSSLVTLNGDVRQPGQVPLALHGERLLDVLARAGGSATPASETYVTFIRGQKRAEQLLKTVYERQVENVYVRPGDQIILSHNPQTFTAFGAVSKVGEYPIQAGEVSLIEALGRVGGLSENSADRLGMFVFRYEDADLVRELQPDVRTKDGSMIPVVYRIDMRQTGSYFLAQQFNVQNSDILYVSNSYGAELTKFARILSTTAGVVRSTTVISF
ncbi:polysaccharide export protein [Pseudovibrio exalbescens]|uniref:polysaccharide biosynthesis/export family protein n=1 Tax=Pseudovibrio exalbescens TaxID=197461 RepID=UPI002365CF43|nr:polysaccharide biosynthesis/export family protein [Pseudovibrio exalbescens]MDD7911624.1 polysaccharide export protein [Pseudovibrio exalbescens]